MGTIQSGTGLASGLDIKSIVDALINAQKGTTNRLSARIKDLQTTDAGLLRLTVSVQDFKGLATTLKDKTLFSKTSFTSSDSTQFGVTLGTDAVAGTYNVQALRKASTQQMLSKGYAAASQLVGTGTVSIAKGGQVTSRTRLDALNGGAGVSAGSIRVTDRSGASAVIDLTSAVHVDDVLSAINNNTGISVSARVEGGRIILADKTGQSSSNLSVTNVGTGATATQLGLLQNVAADKLTGSNIYEITGDFKLSQINDGLGVRIASSGSTIRISLTDVSNSQVDVDLNGAVTVQDVVTKINSSTNNAGKVSAEIQNGRIVLQDLTGGGGAGTLSVTDLTGSSVAKQLGLTTTASGATLTGNALGAGLNSVLLRNLRGGQGISHLGTLNLTDRTGTTAAVDLSQAQSLNDVLSSINNATSTGLVKLQLTATYNASHSGIVITDTSGSTAHTLEISDAVGSTIAADLGITVNAAQTSVSSGSLGRQYLNESSSLTAFAKNKSLQTGSFRIQDSQGVQTAINLTSATATIGDLIDKINTTTGGTVTAHLNDTGDGIKLVDHAGGAGQLEVSEVGSSIAENLFLKGTGATVSGHSELSARQTIKVDVASTDTLTSLTQKLNNAGAGVTASLVDTGATINPLRLSLTSGTSGYAGELVIDETGLNLGLTNSTQAQDAVIRVGTGSGGYTYTSSTNRFTQVATGLTLDLKNVGTQPTEINITTDTSQVVTNLKSFATKYNALLKSSSDLTAFNLAARTAGALQGDNVVQRVVSRINSVRNFVNVDSSSSIKSLIDLGFRVGDGGNISLDETKLQAALAENPTAVSKFLNDTTNGFGKKLDDAVQSLTDQFTGMITLQTKSIESTIETTQKRLDSLNVILEGRRSQLMLQFTNMEKTLSSLQSQQAALTRYTSSLTGTSTSSSSSSK